MGDELIIIITRVNEQADPNSKEWIQIWKQGDDDVCLIVDKDWKCKNVRWDNSENNNIILHSSIDKDLFDSFKVIVFRGDKNTFYPRFNELFKNNIKRNRDVLMAIHPGYNKSFNELKQNMKNSMDELNTYINEAVEYSLGDTPNENDDIVIFAKSLKKTDKDRDTNIETVLEKLKEWILGKKRKFHYLIALSILCQGYLAAHDVIKLPNGISISDDKKKLTKEQGWWKPAFENEQHEIPNGFDKTLICKELSSPNKDCEKDKGAIVALFDAIQGANGKDFADTDKVTEAYDCIKEILKGKF